MPGLLVTIDQLEERHSAVASMDTTEVQAAIADASATVRSFTGQTLTVATSTHRLRIRNGRIQVPQRPIISVVSVADVLGNAIEYTVVNGDTIDVRTQVFDTWSMVPYSSPLTEADVEYEHGYNPMDEAVVSVVCQVALRTLTADVADAGVTDEKLGSYGVGFGAVGASGPSGLFAGEKDILRQFKRPLGSMRVLGS